MPSPRRIFRILNTLGAQPRSTMLGSFAGRLSPFKILIGTILSARSRDEMTIKVCRQIFARYPTPERLARARPRDLIPTLRPIGFFRQKSRYIVQAAKLILKRHQGRVPRTLEDLTQLPGVGRKVANCVLVYAFGVPAIPVDTHVHRITNRLGWHRTKTPEETERSLIRFLPKRYWLTVNDILVSHGKSICRPIGPKCGECRVEQWCSKVGFRRRRG